MKTVVELNSPLKVLGILQARMTSTRLPGKVLEPILGKPMILHQIDRLSRASMMNKLVVATSQDSSDDPLAAELSAVGVDVVRGSLDDVLDRFQQVIGDYEPDVVVRLTADCPLASPSVIDQVISGFLDSDLDYLSNTLRPTYPDGLDVEVVRASVLSWVAENASDPPEREHVTLGVYRRPEMFALGNVTNDVDLSDLRWTVDTPEDLEFIRWVYGQLHEDRPDFDLPEVLALLEAHPERGRTSLDAERNAALKGLDTGAMDA